jgi:transposase-like protein
MEIITGVERRRRWRLDDKLRIVAEAEQPGVRFADVARRHEVSRSVLWAWRKQVREGALVAEPAPVFLPVQVTPDVPPALPAAPAEAAAPAGPARAASGAEDGRIEIALPDGTVIRVGEAIGAAALRRVVAALRR